MHKETFVWLNKNYITLQLQTAADEKQKTKTKKDWLFCPKRESVTKVSYILKSANQVKVVVGW